MLEFVDKVQKRGHKVSVFLGDCPVKLDPEYHNGNFDFYFASKLDFLSKVTGTPYPVFRDVTSS